MDSHVSRNVHVLFSRVDVVVEVKTLISNARFDDARWRSS